VVEFTELISEVAHRCDDLGFKDFDKGKYNNALFRANRLVARKYHIFKKLEQFILRNVATDFSKDIRLDLPDMKEPILVTVNDINLRKKDSQILDRKDMYAYYLFRSADGTYFFNYAMGMALEDQIWVQNADINASVSDLGLTDRATDDSVWGKSAADEILILYEALPERDYDETEYVIPTNYEEEQIEFAIIYIAKLGIAKFDKEKLGKYTRLHNLYNKRDMSINPEVIESKEPIRIQLFQYP